MLRHLLCACLAGAAFACTHDDHHGGTGLDGGPSPGDAATSHDPATTAPNDGATPEPDATATAPDMDAARADPAADGGRPDAAPARDAAASSDDDAGDAAANGGDQVDDDAGDLGRDGIYTCQPEQPFGYDCVDPWLDSAYQRPDAGGSSWTFTLANGRLTLDGYGFDQAQIACTGSWSGDTFTCAAQWSRAGRMCDNALHLRAQTDGTLIFSVAMRLEELASCQRQ
jgi:hypothetical protein